MENLEFLKNIDESLTYLKEAKKVEDSDTSEDFYELSDMKENIFISAILDSVIDMLTDMSAHLMSPAAFDSMGIQFLYKTLAVVKEVYEDNLDE